LALNGVTIQKEHFGTDEIGVYRQLRDGRVLRVQQRLHNALLTVSSSHKDLGWRDGW
jgi:hypothetical protein